MKIILSYVAIALLCLGCASNSPKQIETITIYKPVYTAPKAAKDLKDIERPDVSSNYLSEQDKKDPGKVVKTLLETIAQLRVYAEQLENNEQACRAMLDVPSDPVPEPTHSVETHK